MSEIFVGVDIGGTKAATLVVDRTGRALGSSTVSSRGDGRTDESIVDALWQGADQAVRDAGVPWSRVAAVGLGAPGSVDPESGLWWGSTNLILNSPPYPLAEEIARRSGRPAFVENDVKAAALGESRFGRGREIAQDLGGLLFISVGTGLAACLVVDGEVFRGRRDAGEIGHIPLHPGGHPCACGQQGCLETVASGRALVRWGRWTMEAKWRSKFRDFAGGDPARLDGGMIMQAAIEGDPVAESLVERLADGIALSVLTAFRAYDPAAVVLGGGVVAGGGEYLFGKVKASLARQSPRYMRGKVVETTSLGARAGALGAAAVAISAWTKAGHRAEV